MLAALQIAAILLVAIGMGLSLAHALEFPGKTRLGREEYFVVQKIYYPGFTVGGLFGEFGAMIATLALAVATYVQGRDVRLSLAAFIALVGMHAIFWLMTQPVNKIWLKDQKLNRAGSAFFAAGGEVRDSEQDWTRLRDRWEYSHVARAVCAMASLAALAADAVLT
jgi:hypothetical protein